MTLPMRQRIPRTTDATRTHSVVLLSAILAKAMFLLSKIFWCGDLGECAQEKPIA